MLRKPDSISPLDVLIEDPIMEPYFITKAPSGGYTVYRRISKSASTKEYIDTICYPSTFNHALKVICREQLTNPEKKHYKTIKEYMDVWVEIQNKMQTMTTIE